MEKEINYKLDKWDTIVAISSGALTAALDVFFVEDISLSDAHTWGTEKTKDFVIKVAKLRGYKGENLSGAIRKLEDDFPMAGDKLTSDFGGGKQHHLRDFSHHPTPMGLFFSILMQLTGKGYGTSTTGKFERYEIKGWKQQSFEKSIYLGTVGWLFHLISDMAGSSGTVSNENEGTGVPGGLLSFLKMTSSMPGVKNIAGKSKNKNGKSTENYSFSVMCTKLFDGTLLGEHDEDGKIVKGTELRFDFRTELGIVNESMKNKQYLPVILNEIIVSAFYSVRRFLILIQEQEIKQLDDIEKEDLRKCLPWKNTEFKRMRMIATSTFSVIDISSAGIKAAIKNKNNKKGFALDFMQGINYWGIGHLILVTNDEFLAGLQKLQEGFLLQAEQQKRNLISAIPEGEEVLDISKFAVNTAVSVAKLGTPPGFVYAAIGVYDEIKKSLDDLKLAKEERVRIEKECEERIEVIKEYREEMNATVSDYLYKKMYIMGEAFDQMNRAITENDIEMYILGNNMIQKELSGKVMFENEKEFDELMMSDSNIKF